MAFWFFCTWELTDIQTYEHFYFSISHLPVGSKACMVYFRILGYVYITHNSFPQQSSDLGVKQKSELNSRLEEKTNQMAATIKQLEQR